MQRIIFIIAIITVFAVNSCIEKYKYPYGSLPSTPENMEAFNSEYDDYNSSAPFLGTLIPLCFSTNRNSEGESFDIIYEPLNINWDKKTGILTLENNYSNYLFLQPEYSLLEDALEIINTEGNELGPYFLINNTNTGSDYSYLFMYASDVNGNYDIRFTWNRDFPEFNDSQAIDFINTPGNDLYPAFNMNFSQIYFCSDRKDGVFNIYSAPLGGGGELLVAEFTDDSAREITKHEILSSDYNDKCPFIYTNLMIFASDRPGGEGGYDLYYSLYEQGSWSEPVNFGPYINSPYDDYRPIIVNDGVDSTRDMMIFSSNREGGMGGFDLYFVGIDKIGTY